MKEQLTKRDDDKFEFRFDDTIYVLTQERINELAAMFSRHATDAATLRAALLEADNLLSGAISKAGALVMPQGMDEHIRIEASAIWSLIGFARGTISAALAATGEKL